MVGQQYAWPRPGQQGGALLVVVELHDGDEAEGEHGPRQGHRHLGSGEGATEICLANVGL